VGRVGGHPVPVAVGPSNRESETFGFFQPSIKTATPCHRAFEEVEIQNQIG
jgi:hypothetical protein